MLCLSQKDRGVCSETIGQFHAISDRRLSKHFHFVTKKRGWRGVQAAKDPDCEATSNVACKSILALISAQGTKLTLSVNHVRRRRVTSDGTREELARAETHRIETNRDEKDAKEGIEAEEAKEEWDAHDSRRVAMGKTGRRAEAELASAKSPS